MNLIRYLKILSTSAIATALLSMTAYGNVQPDEYTVPDSGSSALMLCGAIAAIYLARRRLAK